MFPAGETAQGMRVGSAYGKSGQRAAARCLNLGSWEARGSVAADWCDGWEVFPVRAPARAQRDAGTVVTSR